MAAPKGNQYWKSRKKHGPKRRFKSPEQLWGSCCEYFEWVDSHPLFEDKLYSYRGKAFHVSVPKMRAMTVTGLCSFLGIGIDTWIRYRNDEDLCDIVTRVDMIIQAQKFEGAAAGLLNPNIIARDLGLGHKPG